MTGRALLDTNIVIALFAQEESIIDGLQTAEEVFVPSIVLGELYFGARKSQRVAENLNRLDAFVLANTILSCTVQTARYYGQVKAGLSRQGRPIPENDIWIAALAIQHDLILVSRDAHFQAVEDLRIEWW